MATRTSVESGHWNESSTWDGPVPVNGDSVVIAEGHEVHFNVDQSGFANGLAGLVINGLLLFESWNDTYLKMNGNITGTGALYVCYFADDEVQGMEWVRLEGFENVYIMDNYGFESCIHALLGEKDSDWKFTEYKKVNSIQEVENTPGSYFIDVEDVERIPFYVHCLDDANPIGESIVWDIMPIQRPEIGSESRCQLVFNSTGTINIPVVEMHGQYPEREYTQLDAPANLGATEIILVENLDLQQGDKIAMGSGTENGMPAEASKGVYTVQSYNEGTKTVTLTSGLAKERLKDDYVCIASRPIKLSRTSGTTAFITSKIDDMVFKGVNFTIYAFMVDAIPSLTCHNATFRHCTSSDKVLAAYGYGHLISKCTRVGGSTSQFIQAYDSVLRDSICISGSYSSYTNNIDVINCVEQNTQSHSVGRIVKDCIIQNFGFIRASMPSKFINCIFKGNDIEETPISTTQSIFVNYITPTEFFNCVFKDNDTGYLKAITARLYGCTFEGNNEINTFDKRKPVWAVTESFDHNQQPGNYKAWMPGGRIKTQTINDVIQPGKLIFQPESNNYPVYRDYPLYAPANKITKYYIRAIKDFTGGVVKAEIIDPANDPLIDPSAESLAQTVMPDFENIKKLFTVRYKSPTSKQLILRISARNSEGEVLFDPPFTYEFLFRGKKELK